MSLFEIFQAYEEEEFYKFLLDVKYLEDVNKLCQSVIERFYRTLCSNSNSEKFILCYYEMIYKDVSSEFESTYGIYFGLMVTKYGIK